MRKRLQNRVAESRFAFPATVLYAAVIWLANGVVGERLYVQLAIFAISSLMMMTLNNRNSLIRIYSRMVSCSFIAMTCAATFLFSSLNAIAVQALFILFYLTLLRSYQNKRAQGAVFYAFFFLGIASMFFVQILFYVPFLWILMASNMMAMSHKMFWASIIGIIAPYWFIGGYYLYTGNADELLTHFTQLADFQSIFNYADIDLHKAITFGIMCVFSIIGITHFMRNSYLDKIRTRMIFEMFITVDILTIIFIILQPQHINTLLTIMIVNTSCLFAHYIALTRTRVTNIVCILAFCLTIGLTIFNSLF